VAAPIAEHNDSDGFAARRRRILEAKDRGDGDYLVEALVDPDHRALAAESLGELRVVEATDPLIRLLAAADPQVRCAAAIALGQIGSREALPRLRELGSQDEEAFVRSWAIGAIGKIGGRPEATEFLLPFLRDPSLRVRSATAIALGRLGDARALPALRRGRPRLLRSPVDWWASRRSYDEAIAALSEKERGR
jgi:HEAT repeat protein